MGSIVNDITNSLTRRKIYIEIFFVIFFMVGFAGIAFPFSRHLFLKLFPVALLLSFFTILLFHQHSFDGRTIAVLFLTGILGYFIEVTGVNTHLIFGNYQYGNALGIKILNTPLLIGINWVMLTYAGSSITDRLNLPVSLKIVIAALFMLLYDIILEQIAPVLDMWHWENNVVPVRNYVAWFLVAVIFQALLKISGIKTRNSIVITIILIQIVFFIALIVFFKLTK